MKPREESAIDAKPEPKIETTNKGIAALEAQLDDCQQVARRNLEAAQSLVPAEGDFRQEDAYRRAIAFMKVSAKVAVALAKLKNEHTSHVHVRRTNVAEKPFVIEFPAPLTAKPPAPPVVLDDATTDAINKLYRDWVKSRAASHGDVQPWSEEAALAAQTEAFEARRRAERMAKLAGEGEPPSVFSGSNAGK